ncbi:MAG TPA: hypothetical protein VEB22_11370 [Phycisphaerales bacterium]|nr:hypothetical protein [Phycisphaerales bacterium]
MTAKNEWSFITGEQLESYANDAQRLFDEMRRFAQANGIKPFAGGLCGALMVRAVNEMMGGDLRWWHELIDDPEVLFKKYRFKMPPGGFVGEGGEG